MGLMNVAPVAKLYIGDTLAVAQKELLEQGAEGAEAEVKATGKMVLIKGELWVELIGYANEEYWYCPTLQHSGYNLNAESAEHAAEMMEDLGTVSFRRNKIADRESAPYTASN